MIGQMIEKLALAQFNIVVVDDGSTDQTANIALQYPVYVLTFCTTPLKRGVR